MAFWQEEFPSLSNHHRGAGEKVKGEGEGSGGQWEDPDHPEIKQLPFRRRM